jgi:hypothetical protein
MVIMIDEMFDRAYQSGHADFNAGLTQGFARLASAIGNSFEVLNRIEYSTPWTAKRTRVRSH